MLNAFANRGYGSGMKPCCLQTQRMATLGSCKVGQRLGRHAVAAYSILLGCRDLNIYYGSGHAEDIESNKTSMTNLRCLSTAHAFGSHFRHDLLPRRTLWPVASVTGATGGATAFKMNRCPRHASEAETNSRIDTSNCSSVSLKLTSNAAMCSIFDSMLLFIPLRSCFIKRPKV